MTENVSKEFSNALSQKNLLVFTGFLGILLLVSTYIFGLYVLAMAVVSYAAALVVESLFAKFRKKPLDKAWMVTPMVLVLLLPPDLPLWMVAVGSSFGVLFGKSLFGGFGKNVFNPAIVGLLFITISFPRFLNTMWLNPRTGDVDTAASINLFNANELNFDFLDLFIGNVPGSLGTTFRLGILILGVILILLKIIDWRIPVFYLGTILAASYLADITGIASYGNPFLSIMVGSVMFAAFFVATDHITGPIDKRAKIVYAIGLGIITFIIRAFGTFAEGVVFAVILMNAIAPLIDSYFIKDYEPSKEEKEDIKEAMA
ncbi:MAG: RnfABCDGE type electron transport complex subunit D [Bacillota bacterium]